jgi:XTP/dITP diphosphohydrolase
LHKSKLFIASKNKGKIEEIRFCLNDTTVELLSFLDHPEVPDVEETGSTFEENAWLKAKQVYDFVKIPVIADDSGLEVAHLNGAPGVYSSRYAGETATDDDNCVKLLKVLSGISNRRARFVCVIVFYDGMEKNVFEGLCNGTINHGKKGSGGFGYDPLFVPDGFEKTYAELDPVVKNRISHRGKALKKLVQFYAGLY